MANTFVAIATVTVGSGGSGSITFSSIPNTYTDLVLKCSARTGQAAPYTDIDITLNSESARQWQGFYQVNSTVGASNNTAFNIVGEGNGTSTTASTFSNFELYIPNYTSSNLKTIVSEVVQENDAVGSALDALHANSVTNGTAISSITLVPFDSQSFVQYTTATLYGIKNS